MERTPSDDVTGFCAEIDDVIVDVVVALASATVGEFIRTFNDAAVAETDAALLGDAGDCFCCDGVETATTGDVITCGGDVTDWLGAVAAIGCSDADTALDNVTSF